jgi:hypothetical protein
MIRGANISCLFLRFVVGPVGVAGCSFFFVAEGGVWRSGEEERGS